MIYRTMLKSKIHRAVVTDANVDYPGSISIDAEIMLAADIIEHEKVHVLGLVGGARLETYAISGEAGAHEICINGAAARLISPGEKIIILTYAGVPDREARSYRSKVVLVDDENKISAIKEQGQAFELC